MMACASSTELSLFEGSHVKCEECPFFREQQKEVVLHAFGLDNREIVLVGVHFSE